MSIKQKDSNIEEMVEDQIPEQDQPRTSRGKHSTPASEGREAKRISQSNTAFPTHTPLFTLSLCRRKTRATGQVSTT